MPMKSKRSKLQEADLRRRTVADPNGQIADQLRAYYSTLEEEPVPPHLLHLLEKLDEAEEAALLQNESVG